MLLALPPGPQTEEMVAFGLDAYWGSPELRHDRVVSPVAPGGRLFFRGAERHIPAPLVGLALLALLVAPT